MTPPFGSSVRKPNLRLENTAILVPHHCHRSLNNKIGELIFFCFVFLHFVCVSCLSKLTNDDGNLVVHKENERKIENTFLAQLRKRRRNR